MSVFQFTYHIAEGFSFPLFFTVNCMEKSYFVHESSYIDEPVSIGEGTKIWRFCHIMKVRLLVEHPE